MNIQITGASGSGKTFLGRELAKVLKCNFVDTDDILWVWQEDIQPYTIPISDEEAKDNLKKILANNTSTVASGLFYPWSEDLIPMFGLLIIVETDVKIRKKELLIESSKCMEIDLKKVEICMSSLINIWIGR